MLPLSRFRIADSSMEPTLRPGDYVLVSRWAYRLRVPRPGDVVVLRDPAEPARYLVKRVAGTEDGRFIVLGDNLAGSRDSRSFGAVTKGAIVGKVLARARA